jgi:microcompartment protein CcmL/EutN
MSVPVLGVLEISSIAMGIKTMDEIVKMAPIRIIDAKTICPGKFVIVFTGDVASVDASLSKGKAISEGYLIDELFIPNLHPQIIPAMEGGVDCSIWDAIGVLECFSTTASIEAGDIAAKTAQVLITEIRLETGLGGKSYVKMMGDIYEVEASMKAGKDYIRHKGLLCKDIIIAKPDPGIKEFFLL